MRIYLLFISFCVLFVFSCSPRLTKKINHPEYENSFSFVFVTDIHLKPEDRAPVAFQKVIDTINYLSPDFVINGGDFVYDALGVPFQQADSLYKMYADMSQKFTMPVYHAIGNHELFGVYRKSGADSTHKFYGKKMFQHYWGKDYYSFDHKGWHFMVLNSVAVKSGKYFGHIDSVQMDWIKQDLEKLPPQTPVAISLHMPLLSSYSQFRNGALTPNTAKLCVDNSKEVLQLFEGNNLKLVLQGHLHYLEDVFVANKIHFVTGGAVCGKWWGGSINSIEEGFLYFTVNGGDFSWKYIDYGWEVE